MPRRSGFPIVWLLAALACAGSGLLARGAAAEPCTATHLFDTVSIPTDSGATQVNTADLNGDGRSDLAVIRGARQSFEVMLRGSDNQFTSHESHSWTTPILRSILADLDGDGRMDLAFTDDSSRVVIFRGGGDGSLTLAQTVSIGTPVFDLVSADLDADGHPEIVVSQPTTAQISTLRWVSAPFGYAIKLNTNPTAFLPDPYFLAVGKIDADARFDLLASRRSGTRVLLLRGGGTGAIGDGTFALSLSITVSGAASSLRLADLDADGFLDFAYGMNGALGWMFGLGTGFFTGAATTALPGLAVRDFAVSDLNLDGNLDLLCLSDGANQVAQVLGLGGRGFAYNANYSLNTAPASIVRLPPEPRSTAGFVVSTRSESQMSRLVPACGPTPILINPPNEVEVVPPNALPDPGPLPAASAWPLEGVVVCNATGNQTEYQAVDDFAHGAYFAWVDERNGEKDIYAVRLDASGQVVPGWAPNGTPVCRASGAQSNLHCFTDGKWGVWLTWSDLRSGIPSLYMQKLTTEGQPFPGWPADGRRFCADTAAGYVVATDRRGGMQIVWSKFAGGSKWTYMQHLDTNGQPFGVWPACGKFFYQDYSTFSTCLDQSHSLGPAIPAWPDGIRYTSYDHYNCKPFAAAPPSDCYWCISITPSNSSTGLALPSPSPVPNLIANREALPESAPPLPETNAYCGSLQLGDDGYGGYDVFDSCNQFYRYGVFGNPSWQISTGEFRDPLPAGDNTFNLLRYDYASGQYFVARVLNDGTWSPGFGSAGVLVAQAPSSGIDHIYRVTDGNGGMLIAWTDARVPGSWPFTGQFYATWLRSDGTRGPGWRVDGNPIGNVGVAAELDFAVADRRGSAILGWRDSREGEANLYASRVTVESPPSAEATTLGPFKRVMTDAMRGAPVPPNVTPELSFAGPRPNPAAGDAAVEFTLSRSGDVSIRVLDVAGRTVRTRELRGLGAGQHRVVLDDGTALAPGIYVVELDAERKRLTRKLVVAR